ELQCSDWSHRPLTEEQKLYAATDAHCLLQIINVFKSNLVEEITLHDPNDINVGLKDILNGSACTSKAADVEGIDAAVPPSKKPDSRELLDQALKENRVLLTRDTKLLRHQDLAKHQIYRVKSLLKNEQLLEVQHN
ncbi:unnamed protein product, partial [Brassica rapa]